MLRLLILILATLSASAQAPATDPQIEAQLHDRLVKSVIGKDGFTAKVKAGVVYWEGTTTVAQHKGAATRIAKSSGARRVVNNIKVKKAPGSPAPPKKAGESPALPKPTAEATPTVASPPPPQKRVTVQWRTARP